MTTAKGPWAAAATGTIEKINRWSDTKVWSSGGGGYVDPKFGGHVESAQVHSRVTQRCEAFIRKDDGSEMALDLGFTGLKLREGSRIFLLSGAPSNSDSGYYAYAENLDTGEYWTQVDRLSIGGEFFVLFAWLFKLLVCLLVLAPLIYFSVFGASSVGPDPSVAIKLRVIATSGCRYAEDLTPINTLKFLKPEYCQKPDAPAGKCLCEVAKITSSSEHQNRSYVGNLEEFSGISAVFGSIFLSPFFATFWQKAKNRGRRNRAITSRKAYLAKLIETAGHFGIKLFAVSAETMQLRRANIIA